MKRKERDGESAAPNPKRAKASEDDEMHVEDGGSDSTSLQRVHPPLHRMQKHSKLTMERVEKFVGKHHLLQRLYTERVAIQMSVWHAPDRVTFSEQLQHAKEYAPIECGGALGKSWSTHWIRAEIAVPDTKEWRDGELHLLFDCGGEVLVWSEAGEPIQGMNGQTGEDRRTDFRISKGANASSYVFYLEVACNELFGNSAWNIGPSPPDLEKMYHIKQAELGLFSREAWQLLLDLKVIVDTAKHQDENSMHRARALATANEIVNVVHLDNPSTYRAGRELAGEYFGTAFSSPLQLFALGHCHIDTAWLWPYAETRRKCARSWSTQLRIMDEYPQFKFVCSQAQQMKWLKEGYPSLFARVQQKVKEKQFIPIGGTWVEMDCNIPGGESLVRQFLLGQRFFEQEFGSRSTIFWLPDTFGYAAQLPQIVQQCGIKYFLTQKLSWNQFNKFPHNTFLWEGIDGSRVLTHFPPADNYCSHANVADVRKSETNFKDKERCDSAMLVYGHGDGGGGPNPGMVEMLQRMRNGAGGLPRVRFDTPEEFFSRCAAQSNRLCVWRGELYFEYHRGTYTTQARNKLHNRFCEQLLHDIEFVGSLSHVLLSAPYPREELNRLWELLLLNQFHDVIPGTSIPEVFEDSEKHYALIREEGEKLFSRVIGPMSLRSSGTQTGYFAVNTTSVDRIEVVEWDTSLDSSIEPVQSIGNGKALGVIEVPALSYARCPLSAIQLVRQQVFLHEEPDGSFVLANHLLHARVSKSGHITSLRLTEPPSLETMETSHGAGGNNFVMYDDNPLFWDAWDVDCYHLEKPVQIPHVAQCEVVERGPLRVALKFSLKLSEKSSLTQLVRLSSSSPYVEFVTEVDWHEEHKFLKVEFPCTVRNDHASYEIPFGFVKRSTHFNTSNEMAKFEVCAQQWADLSQYGLGVAVINDSKYGYAVHDNVIRLSLLRSPKEPDPQADMGKHTFRYGVMPHAYHGFQEAGVAQVAIAFNNPLRLIGSSAAEALRWNKFIACDCSAVVIDTLKISEASTEQVPSVVVRVHETFESTCKAKMRMSFPVQKAVLCNMLEDDGEELFVTDNCVQLSFAPFEIKSIKFYLDRV